MYPDPGAPGLSLPAGSLGGRASVVSTGPASCAVISGAAVPRLVLPH